MSDIRKRLIALLTDRALSTKHWYADEDAATIDAILAEYLVIPRDVMRKLIELQEMYSDARYPDFEGGYASAMDDVMKLLSGDETS